MQSWGLRADDGVDVQFLENHAAVFDLPAGNDLEIAELGIGFSASVGLDEPNHDIDAVAAQCMGIFNHRIGLADAWRRADIDAQSGALLGQELRQHLLSAGTTCFSHRSTSYCASSCPGPGLYELFMDYDIFTDS